MIKVLLVSSLLQHQQKDKTRVIPYSFQREIGTQFIDFNNKNEKSLDHVIKYWQEIL
jgi:hypothetical protein